MRKTLLPALCAALALLTSCSASKYTVAVDLTGPTKSGVTVMGRTVAVAYNDMGTEDHTLFLASAADGFTEALEEQYFSGDEVVELFKVDRVEGVENSSKEGMIDLVMETGSDLVFLFDVNYSGSSTDPSELTLYVYDSLDSSDTVKSYSGKVSLGKWDYDLHGRAVGQRSADIFAPTWTRENLAFYYFGSEKWNDAIEAAADYKFKDAVEIWLTLVDSKDSYKAAVAMYNVATVCYLYAQYPLALSWLDQADQLYEIPESAPLRRKINKKFTN
ncbi:MAG: tetratricopeptide repeat protein [Bacteroidales bacterium]|nr:tetratricopeptide repeat protein [Bacteroidales bacterium]